MLLPDRYNFVIWAGATFRNRLTLYTDEGVTLRNLTGYTASLIIRDEPQGTPLLTLTTVDNSILLGGVNGTIELVITASATAAITWTTGVYDLTITAPTGGDTDALLYGHFTVKGI